MTGPRAAIGSMAHTRLRRVQPGTALMKLSAPDARAGAIRQSSGKQDSPSIQASRPSVHIGTAAAGSTNPQWSVRDAITRRPDLSRIFAGEEPPLRAELFSREQMAQHGQVLAGLAPVERRRAAPIALLTRLARERDPADRRPGPADGGRERRPPDHAGRRVAARQLLPDRGADPHGAAAPARRATAASCRAWPTARRPGCRGSTTSRSRRSRTATAGSTPTASAASSPPTRR